MPDLEPVPDDTSVDAEDDVEAHRLAANDNETVVSDDVVDEAQAR